MDPQHLHPGQEGSPASLLPEETEEGPSVSSDSGELLPLHHRLPTAFPVWYDSCSAVDRKALQRVVKTAQCITGSSLSTIEAVQGKRCLRRAHIVVRDSSHPSHRLFALLPSGRRYRVLRTRTSRFRNSFFPTAVTLHLDDTPHTLPTIEHLNILH